MIRHGETGCLLPTDDELAYYAIARLAYDGRPSLALVPAARKALLQELADPAVALAAWRVLFAELGWK